MNNKNYNFSDVLSRFLKQYRRSTAVYVVDVLRALVLILVVSSQAIGSKPTADRSTPQDPMLRHLHRALETPLLHLNWDIHLTPEFPHVRELETHLNTSFSTSENNPRSNKSAPLSDVLQRIVHYNSRPTIVENTANDRRIEIIGMTRKSILSAQQQVRNHATLLQGMLNSHLLIEKNDESDIELVRQQLEKSEMASIQQLAKVAHNTSKVTNTEIHLGYNGIRPNIVTVEADASSSDTITLGIRKNKDPSANDENAARLFSPMDSTAAQPHIDPHEVHSLVDKVSGLSRSRAWTPAATTVNLLAFGEETAKLAAAIPSLQSEKRRSPRIRAIAAMLYAHVATPRLTTQFYRGMAKEFYDIERRLSDIGLLDTLSGVHISPAKIVADITLDQIEQQISMLRTQLERVIDSGSTNYLDATPFSTSMRHVLAKHESALKQYIETVPQLRATESLAVRYYSNPNLSWPAINESVARGDLYAYADTPSGTQKLATVSGYVFDEGRAAESSARFTLHHVSRQVESEASQFAGHIVGLSQTGEQLNEAQLQDAISEWRTWIQNCGISLGTGIKHATAHLAELVKNEPNGGKIEQNVNTEQRHKKRRLALLDLVDRLYAAKHVADALLEDDALITDAILTHVAPPRAPRDAAALEDSAEQYTKDLIATYTRISSVLRTTGAEQQKTTKYNQDVHSLIGTIEQSAKLIDAAATFDALQSDVMSLTSLFAEFEQFQPTGRTDIQKKMSKVAKTADLFNAINAAVAKNLLPIEELRVIGHQTFSDPEERDINNMLLHLFNSSRTITIKITQGEGMWGQILSNFSVVATIHREALLAAVREANKMISSANTTDSIEELREHVVTLRDQGASLVTGAYYSNWSNETYATPLSAHDISSLRGSINACITKFTEKQQGIDGQIDAETAGTAVDMDEGTANAGARRSRPRAKDIAQLKDYTPDIDRLVRASFTTVFAVKSEQGASNPLAAAASLLQRASKAIPNAIEKSRTELLSGSDISSEVRAESAVTALYSQRLDRLNTIAKNAATELKGGNDPAADSYQVWLNRLTDSDAMEQYVSELITQPDGAAEATKDEESTRADRLYKERTTVITELKAKKHGSIAMALAAYGTLTYARLVNAGHANPTDARLIAEVAVQQAAHDLGMSFDNSFNIFGDTAIDPVRVRQSINEKRTDIDTTFRFNKSGGVTKPPFFLLAEKIQKKLAPQKKKKR